jgi:hypothetical protein
VNRTLKIRSILILLASLFLVGNVYALPPCPPDVFHNCFGTKTLTNGAKYVGEWKGGTISKGTFTSANGMRIIGEWKDGKTWEGVFLARDGSVFVTISKGVQCSVFPCKPTPRQLSLVREITLGHQVDGTNDEQALEDSDDKSVMDDTDKN